MGGQHGTGNNRRMSSRRGRGEDKMVVLQLAMAIAVRGQEVPPPLPARCQSKRPAQKRKC